MCFSSGSSTPAQPTPPSPGIIDTSKATPDPSQAYKYRGEPIGANNTGRNGGTMLLDAADKQAAKQSLGG